MIFFDFFMSLPLSFSLSLTCCWVWTLNWWMMSKSQRKLSNRKQHAHIYWAQLRWDQGIGLWIEGWQNGMWPNSLQLCYHLTFFKFTKNNHTLFKFLFFLSLSFSLKIKNLFSVCVCVSGTKMDWRGWGIQDRVICLGFERNSAWHEYVAFCRLNLKIILLDLPPVRTHLCYLKNTFHIYIQLEWQKFLSLAVDNAYILSHFLDTLSDFS